MQNGIPGDAAKGFGQNLIAGLYKDWRMIT